MSEAAATRAASKSPSKSPSRSPARSPDTQGNITAEPAIELDAEDITDDSASETASLASSTTSVTASVLDYRRENGRTYHKYKDGQYMFPNDDTEVDRLDVQHYMYVRTFDGRLGTAPPAQPGSKVGRVLDCGTGSGIWAIEFGDEHPDAEVIGVDLSPVVPSFVPPNVTFEIDDLEEPWTYSKPFDYIHSRMLPGAIRDWKAYFKQCYDNLNPGGYFEVNECDVIPLSDDGTLKDDSHLVKCTRLIAEAAAMMGRSFPEIQGLKDIMVEVGFEDVHVQPYKWPTNPWPRDPKHKDLGAWNGDNFARNWEGLSMGPLTRGHGYTKEEVLVFAMEVRKELADRSIHAYFSIISIYGRKPQGE